MQSEMLPEGWVRIALSKVTVPVSSTKPEDDPERVFGYVDISSIDNRTFKVCETKRFKGSDAPSRARRPIQAEDILFSNVRTYLRNIAIVSEQLGAQLCSTGFTILRSNSTIDPKLIFFYVLSDEFIDAVTPQQTGTHYPATSDRTVLAQSIPVPPLAEQKRIVAKVDELLTRVNACRERLVKVPTILKRFRQSVLAAATSGRLTADWRELNDSGESGHSTVRRTIAEYIGQPRSRYKVSDPLEAPNSDVGSELPESWCYAFLRQLLSEPLANGRSVVDGDGFPVLRLTALKNGRIDLKERKRGAWSAAKADPFIIRKGDFLVSRGNGSLSLVGRGGLVEDDPDPVAYPDTLIRIRTSKHIDTCYLRWVWGSRLLRSQIEEAAHTTAGIHKISQKDIAGFALPVPPLREQEEVSRRIERLFALADVLESHLERAKDRTDKLTQAILAKAFRGELVPTEAELARREGRSYETAAELLARIRAERESAPAPTRRRSPKRSPRR